MKALFILNDPPYGTERASQKTPDGYWSAC
jgi:hypothetical protein